MGIDQETEVVKRPATVRHFLPEMFLGQLCKQMVLTQQRVSMVDN